MQPRRVELPKAAKRCWPKALELVDALTRECATLEHEDWHLGGGTALAADWKHRTSTDIDILIAPGLSMSALGADGNARIDQLIESQGGSRLEAPDQKLSVEYEPDGKVDIFSSGRQLPGHEERIEIDGAPARRLSDAQIFAGKFRRAIEGHAVARDLFDICYAAKTGRRGFEQALNALTEEERRVIASLWEAAKAKIAEEAGTKLAGVKGEDRIPPEELADRTARALREYRYADTIIRAGTGRAVVRTLTVNGQEREYESTADTLKRDFEARGISRYLMRRNIRPQAILKKVLEHINERRTVDIRQIETPEAGEAHRAAGRDAEPRKATTPGGDRNMSGLPERPPDALKRRQTERPRSHTIDKGLGPGS